MLIEFYRLIGHDRTWRPGQRIFGARVQGANIGAAVSFLIDFKKRSGKGLGPLAALFACMAIADFIFMLAVTGRKR